MSQIPAPIPIPIPIPTEPKFRLQNAARPMMARDADCMYWMSRYVERAEHIARLLLVNSNLLIDMGDFAPSLQHQQWQRVLTALRTNMPADLKKPGKQSITGRITRFMAFDIDNSNSLLSCVSMARENARAIRENISAEMWESLNSLYWSIRGDDVQSRFEDAPDDFYRQVMTASMLFQGLTDQTLAHDQRWQFAQLAKSLERIDVTARIIENKFSTLNDVDAVLEDAVRNIQWMAILRSCCSIEAYRRQGDMDPLRIAAFLILQANFPRSILYSVDQAHQAMGNIRREVNATGIDPAERILGRLHAQLEYAEVDEIRDRGVAEYLKAIQAQISDAALAVQATYFLM